MTQKIKFYYPKTGLKYGRILQVKLNSTSLRSVLALVRGYISHSSIAGNGNIKFTIFTPNPEIILLAQKDPELLAALNAADLAIPDGVGLKLADPSLKIIKGRELILSLIALANKKNWRVFFLGGLGDEAKVAIQKLEISYKKVKFASASGPILDNQAKPVLERDIVMEKDAITRINKFKPHLLFVAFGCPKQEKWIAKWLPKLKIGGAMTVGGTFRYLAGYAKFPPKWWEKAGLEWLWRLLAEPRRIKRIINAVIVFPLKVKRPT